MMAATPETEIVAGIGNDYKYGFHDEENYVFKSERGLSAEVVAAISERKNEPDYVHVFVDGRIVEEGGPELAHKLEAEGYEAFMPAVAAGGGE